MAKIAEQPQTVTLDQVLEMAERLPIEQQDTLKRVLEKRLSEQNRNEIIARVEEAEADYERGDVIRGDAETIMQALLK
jgi:hypothetical protein